MATEALSSMELKVRELLKEVQLEYSPTFTEFVDDAVSFIKTSIDKIPEDLQVTSDFAPGFVRDIGADKVEFKFKKPESIEIGGSYAMQCVAEPDVNVDLFIRMPKECFYEKDYLNYRYHAKRCLYLSVIKKYLKLSPVVEKVEWSNFQNEARKPILVIHPAIKPADYPSFSLRLIPTTTSVFNISKLKLDRNNIRVLNEGDVPQPTPKYNSSILEDMVIEENASFLREIFLGWKQLGDALILLKVWSRQRSSINTFDCLNGFLLSSILAYLATKSGGNRINKSLSTMQIFRVTVDFIANSKVWDNGLLFESQSEGSLSAKERRMSLKSFPVIVCDPFADFNLAFRMTRSGFLELREEAALTLGFLDKSKDGGFDEVFMTKIDFPAKYDHCIRLNMKRNSEVLAFGFCLDDECWRLYEKKVFSIIHQGLTDRIRSIRVIWRNTASTINLEDGLASFGREPLLIGISVSSTEKAFRVVDIGPDAENKNEALKYRKFWGDKAELRRFKDGRISESTVWECKPWERHLIIKQIIEHVLVRHLSISNDDIISIVDQLDFSLLHGTQDPTIFSTGLLESFETLSKRLRLLSDLPLKVTSVQPLDSGPCKSPLRLMGNGFVRWNPEKGCLYQTFPFPRPRHAGDFSTFRFTSVFPPEPHPLAVEKITNKTLNKLTSSCIQPLEVMIQLEGSGNWPMDDIAIEKTKSAFLLQIGESLQNNWGMTCNATADDMVVISSGYAFRLKILHERSVSLIKKPIGNNQVKQSISTDKLIFYRGQHSSMINGLQGRFPIYGPVVRLVKRWVASHLFSTSLMEEAVELLVAHLFMKPLPFQAPCSRITGFLRFLRLLMEYDWALFPLIIDINGDMSAKDEREINENFMLSRNSVNGETLHNISPAMFLATSYDKASEAWTRSLPTSSELKRLVAYAKSSATLLTKLISQDQPDSNRWECLFRTPLSNYNAVVLLHHDKLPYPQRLLFPAEMNQGRQVVRGKASKVFRPFLLPGEMKGTLKELKNKLMVDFDPLKCFIRGLEEEFPDFFKVWTDSLGGDAIGLTWERSGSKKRGREEGEEEHDPLDLLKTVGEVGKGLVRSVHLVKAPKLAA